MVPNCLFNHLLRFVIFHLPVVVFYNLHEMNIYSQRTRYAFLKVISSVTGCQVLFFRTFENHRWAATQNRIGDLPVSPGNEKPASWQRRNRLSRATRCHEHGRRYPPDVRFQAITPAGQNLRGIPSAPPEDRLSMRLTEQGFKKGQSLAQAETAQLARPPARQQNA